MSHCYTRKKKRNGVRLPTSPDEKHQSVSQNHTAAQLEKKNKFTLIGRVTNLSKTLRLLLSSFYNIITSQGDSHEEIWSPTSLSSVLIMKRTSKWMLDHLAMEGSNLKNVPSLLICLETNLWNSPPLTIKAIRNELGLDCVLNHARVQVSINVLNSLEMIEYIHLPSEEIKQVNFNGAPTILAYKIYKSLYSTLKWNRRSVQLDILSSSPNIIDNFITLEHMSMYISFIYGAPRSDDITRFWNLLTSIGLGRDEEDLFLLGDFNNLLVRGPLRWEKSFLALKASFRRCDCGISNILVILPIGEETVTDRTTDSPSPFNHTKIRNKDSFILQNT
ncbi:LOW QUALITY PROTEIN: hypothetical protein HID58_002678 [Brassica napus]|uniref:Endonuclease/exonuclease/phosphatase domain-containing protein n=1 Tax=Brassica napus TaxID=3708 RepID=A0ABQ8ER11_BRANA|nr:LOW QUALITY PROTEIN: hypothetical protein HID58_002678 [Brassica napus]